MQVSCCQAGLGAALLRDRSSDKHIGARIARAHVRPGYWREYGDSDGRGAGGADKLLGVA